MLLLLLGCGTHRHTSHKKAPLHISLYSRSVAHNISKQIILNIVIHLFSCKELKRVRYTENKSEKTKVFLKNLCTPVQISKRPCTVKTQPVHRLCFNQWFHLLIVKIIDIDRVYSLKV